MSHQMFVDFLRRRNLKSLVRIIDTKASARTAEEAASALDCEVNQIVKSLIVTAGGRFYTFLVPGDQRLDFSLIPEIVGANEARMASADEVKEISGYSIGSVPPFGHKDKLRTFIYTGFPDDKPLYAAAGAIDKVFEISQHDLFRITEAQEWNV